MGAAIEKSTEPIAFALQMKTDTLNNVDAP
jgi:hypothetical protein